jgi:hypothetical protein
MLRYLLSSLLIVIAVLVIFFFFFADFTIPTRAPSLNRTYTPDIHPTPLEIGSFDIFGKVISRAEAEQLLQTEEGQQMLSRQAGAIEITEELIDLGREAFFLETFGNEFFLTDVVGVLDGPINLWTVSRAILGLRGGYTTNLQIPVDEDITIGGRTFPAGSVLNTGLDVPPRSLLPLGMRMRIVEGQIKVGVTCAMCHSTFDPDTGKIIEGATNTNIDTGLILAMASNSAAMFRHTDIELGEVPVGMNTYINADGELAYLPDPAALEDAVDKVFLSWPPGTFDATADLVANPTFIGPSFTFGQWPYGWNGFGSVGWFQGLTTLNNNVHAVSADNTTDAAIMAQLMDIDEESYLGILLQNSASDDYKLPQGARPSAFLQSVSRTPHNPGLIEVIQLPGYPTTTSVFAPTGLLANTDGMPFAEELNAMSAYQHSLAPPPNRHIDDIAALQRGADVFVRAGCQECHSGRFFSNNRVIPLSEIGTQPSRAMGLAEMQELLGPPVVYPPDVEAPIIPGTGLLEIPINQQQMENLRLAYALDGEGGYKVVTLIGIYLHAPYLHDGGVAAGPNALALEGGRYIVVDESELGIGGTLVRGILPDPANSLIALVDREIREAVIAANQANPELQRVNIEGIGHEFWVDQGAGFTLQDQNDLILFLLSLDDNPEVLP